jgi:hypothetical protein
MGNQQGIAIVFDSIVDHPLLMVCQGDDALHRRSPLITIPLLDTPLLFIHWDPNKVNENRWKTDEARGWPNQPECCRARSQRAYPDGADKKTICKLRRCDIDPLD